MSWSRATDRSGNQSIPIEFTLRRTASAHVTVSSSFSLASTRLIKQARSLFALPPGRESRATYMLEMAEVFRQQHPRRLSHSPTHNEWRRTARHGNSPRTHIESAAHSNSRSICPLGSPCPVRWRCGASCAAAQFSCRILFSSSPSYICKSHWQETQGSWIGGMV